MREVSPIAAGTCLKCKKQDLDFVQIRKDLYCHECFLIFTKSKYRRAMDAFRFALPPEERNIKMLLALSGGLSSSVLVDLVYTAITRTRGRYEMPVILYIDEVEFNPTDKPERTEMIRYLKSQYPDMHFIERSMHDIDGYVTSSVPVGSPSSVPNPIDRTHRPTSTAPHASLRDCIAALPSKTSQQDVLSQYRDRLILETAREQSCAAIIYGNSATSLAAKTLSLTAKGRGYALPWETADHVLSHSGIWSVRPMKGLMSTEIQKYAELLKFPASGLPVVRETGVGGSGKAGSIDALTTRYFATLEEQFPSLVATVVRTTNKLVEPVPRDQALGDCKICGMSYREGARKWLMDITVDEAAPVVDDECGGKLRGRLEQEEDLCYGCVVALRGVKKELEWPTFDDSRLERRNHGKQSVLEEFELEDS